MKRLIVCEKPSQARDLAKFLAIRDFKEGYIQNESFIITWCIGHLVELAPMHEYHPNYKQWALRDLPIVPKKFLYKVRDGAKKQFSIVKKLMNLPDVSEIINATDAGREGELIFGLVYYKSNSKKKVSRFWTSNFTSEGMSEAWENLKDGNSYKNLLSAALCRAKADWIVGLNCTRAQTVCFSKNQGPLSVGRVQTPTLSLIVEREKEIENFVSKPFFQISAQFANDCEEEFHGSLFREKIIRFDKKKDAEKILNKLKKEKEARIIEVQKNDRRTPAEKLYDLTTLQRRANNLFNFSAKKTLDLAQSLYEKHKVLSYPRTNSRYLTINEAKTLPKKIRNLKQWKDYNEHIEKILNWKLGKNYVDDTKVEDHSAIIPTGKIPKSLNRDEEKLYELVLKRSIAIYYPDKIEQIAHVKTLVGNEIFISSGRVLIEAGWTTIDQQAPQKEMHLPLLNKDELVKIQSLTMKEKKTSPPQRYTESLLLRSMETAGKKIDDDILAESLKDKGIGTPATRAGIIEGLKNRQYIELIERTLVPTEKGKYLIDSIPCNEIKKADLTGEWEYKLLQIERGEYSPSQFLSEIESYTDKVVSKIKELSHSNVIPREGKEVGSCPKCEGKIYLKSFQSRFYVKCSNPECSLSYSTNSKGVSLGGECSSCRGPVNLTKNKKRVCTLCGKWQNKILGKCFCSQGDFEQREYKSQYFASCTSKTCQLSYPTNKNGEPKEICQTTPLCNGQVAIFKSGSKRCLKCGLWQNSPKNARA